MRTASSNCRSDRHRPGAVAIMILVLLVIITGILGTWTTSIVDQNRQLRAGQNAIQSRWLAESGLRRAVARLAVDPTYTGETWTITGDMLGRPAGGRIVISVATEADSTGTIQVTAQADCPADSLRRVRHTESIDIPNPGFSDGDG